MKDLFYFIYTSSLMVKQLDQRVTIIYTNYYMENIVFKCEFCGRDDFGNKNACNSHRGKCKQNPNAKQTEPSEKWYEARKHLKKYNLQSGTCKFCGRKSTSKSGLSFHEKYCKDNPDRESTENLSHKHSEETKKKISESMKKAHEEGHAFEWIGRKERSYAEQYFYDLFSKEFGTFENNYRVKRYWLDFAWPEKRVYFEVDGKSHYTEEGKAHDFERTEFLKNEGWTLLGRCNWSHFMQLKAEEKTLYISNLIDSIKNSKMVLDIPKKKVPINKALLEGRVDSIGRANFNILSEQDWEERKNKILGCGVDLMKFGWQKKVEIKTSLTRRQIQSTIKHFYDFFEKKSFQRDLR